MDHTAPDTGRRRLAHRGHSQHGAPGFGTNPVLTRTAKAAGGKPAKRGNAARLFGYDIFISFALGPPPRGTQSYASDLARRLRERVVTVFFSEDRYTPTRTRTSGLSVHLAAMPDADHEHSEDVVVDSVDGTPLTNDDPPPVLRAAHLSVRIGRAHDADLSI